MMNWIKRLLTNEKIIEQTKIEKVIVYKTDPNNEWFEFDKIKPPKRPYPESGKPI